MTGYQKKSQVQIASNVDFSVEASIREGATQDKTVVRSIYYKSSELLVS